MKSKLRLILIIFLAFFMAALAFIMIAQSTQNKAYSYEESVKSAKSAISVQEKRRVDLIYNLVDCVKKYDKHESETLLSVTLGRSGTNNVSEASTAIQAVAESYPKLTSDKNYERLMNELTLTENSIADYRENYNDCIETYNRYIRKFINRLFLGFLNYEKIEYDYLEYDAPETAPQNLFDEE